MGNSQYPIHAAVKSRNDLRLQNALIQYPEHLAYRDKKGRLAFHYAAEGGQISTMKILTQFESAIDGVDNRRRTPLHLAAFNGHTEAIIFLREAHSRAVNVADAYGLTPLEIAINRGRVNAVNELLKFPFLIRSSVISTALPLAQARLAKTKKKEYQQIIDHLDRYIIKHAPYMARNRRLRNRAYRTAWN